MHPHIIANFPASFSSYFDTSIMRIAREKDLFIPEFYNLGDFSTQAQHRIDDRPYGGGAGALIEIEPIYDALTLVQDKIQNTKDTVKKIRKIYLGPRGERLRQPKIEQLSRELQNEEFIILC